MRTINSVPFSRLPKYSFSSIRVPSESKNNWSVSASIISWPDEKGDLCFSRQWEFFQHDFHCNNLTKHT